MGSSGPSGVVVIAGGSGFLGQSLARHLTALGAEVIVLARRPPASASGSAPAAFAGRFVPWDARSPGAWCSELDGASAIVNLVGRTVDCVKTPDHRDEILRSRVEATRVLGAALRSVATPPRTWVQMSTAHAYGDPPAVTCDESSPFGLGLAPDVARAWEGAFAESLPSGTRGVVLRTSFVLGRDGGALGKLARLARWGFGGRIGHGRQGMSWLHELDMNRIFERALHDESMTGAYIATAPHPVSNDEFMRELRRAVGARVGLPASEWMVKLGASLILRTDPELALYGRRCVPTRLLAGGFQFRFPTLGEALRDLVGR